MLGRCQNEKGPAYHRYGGRGISVCERWLEFKNFLEDMGLRPADKTLDRIDNDLGYFKDNCRWATKEEQTVNRRSTKWVTFRGHTMPLAVAIRLADIKRHWVTWRVAHCNMDHQQAFDEAVAKHGNGRAPRERGENGKFTG